MSRYPVHRRRVVAAAVTAGALLAPAAALADDNGPVDPGVRRAAKVGPGRKVVQGLFRAQ